QFQILAKQMAPGIVDYGFRSFDVHTFAKKFFPGVSADLALLAVSFGRGNESGRREIRTEWFRWDGQHENVARCQRRMQSAALPSPVFVAKRQDTALLISDLAVGKFYL